MAKRSLQDELKEYGAMFIALKDIIEEVPDNIITQRPKPGKWSAHEILCHIIDTEQNFIIRMKAIIAEDKPTLMPYEPTSWAKRLKYEEWDVKESVLLFGLMRSSMVKILNNLPATAWRRTGKHAEMGPKTLRSILEDANHHCKQHLTQILINKKKLEK